MLAQLRTKKTAGSTKAKGPEGPNTVGSFPIPRGEPGRSASGRGFNLREASRLSNDTYMKLQVSLSIDGSADAPNLTRYQDIIRILTIRWLNTNTRWKQQAKEDKKALYDEVSFISTCHDYYL